MIHFLLLLYLPFSHAAKDLAWYSTSNGAGGISSRSVIHPELQAATAIDFCQLPVDTGKCSQQLVRYYYDAAVDECKRFTFSGCGGNSNRFMRRAHCRNRCVKQPNKLEFQELKHRRTVTTSTPVPTKRMEEVTETTTTTEKREPVTPPVKKVDIVQSGHGNGLCQDCDPLYGTCIDGKCGCMKGFRSLGKVCIDLNECDNGAVCGPNARCVNEIGSFQCVCDAGFSTDGDCKIGQEACMDEFDVNLTEEDCNNGKQEIKYYYDSETVQCKQFFYGGCKTKSRNFFADLQTCDIICVSNQRDYLESKGQSLHHPTHQLSSDVINELKGNHYKIDLFSSPSSPVRPNRPLSADDWPLKPVTLKPALNLDFSEGNTKSTDEKLKEAKDAEELVKELTPDHNICELKFEPVLREECISADWAEKFFWNSDFRDCEPFWYDSSCDPRDRAGKNYFETFEECKKQCDGAHESTYITPTENVENVDHEEEEKEEDKKVLEEKVHPETTTKTPEDEHEENGFFFKVKPQNYLEDVLSTEKDNEPKTHNGFNPNEFLKMNVEKVSDDGLKKIVPKVVPTEENKEIDKIIEEDKIEHDILENVKEKEEKETVQEVVLSEPSTCELEYDADLRNECTSADWTELFYWNPQFKECEAFWYDSSCGAPDYEKKNLFKNWDDCNEKCVKKIGESIKKTSQFDTTTTSTPTTTTATTTATPTTSSIMLEETRRPNYNQNDPLNLILNKALKPDESSELPEKFPPNHEKTFVNFAMKSEVTATTKFDRLKYMAEFRKKLLALPDNFSTTGKLTSPTSIPSTTTKKSDPSTHETTVTQTSKTTTSMAPTETTTTSFNDFVEAEKKKVLETIKILDRPDDLCDEPLHPKLEEDCKNDQWEIKWFFNSDRSACKSFWYGGCEVESRNFFPDHANCRHTCAHKYGTPASFSPKVFIPLGDLSTPVPPRKDRLTTSLKLTYPHSEDLFPNQNHVTVVELDGNFQRLEEQDRLRLNPTKSFKQKDQVPTERNIVNISEGDKMEIAPAFYSHIDRVVHDMKSGGHPGYSKPEEFVRRIEAASNDYIKYDFQKPEVVTVIDKSPPTIPTRPVKETTVKSDPTTKMPSTRSINDPCDDEYDPKWDEDCLGDSWVVRSFYDRKAEKCKAFWYGGCHTSSRNIWFDKETCRTSCAHKFPTALPMIGGSQPDESAESTAEFVSASEASLISSSSSPSSSSNTAHISPEHLFEVDLDQKLADIKKEHEGREDLEYSKIVQHPVTVEADCLEVFNQSLSKPCGDGKSWSNRYYYDKDTRSCRMFWSNGCFDSSKNNFDDLETCQWKCEGRHPQPAGKSCLDKFDERYLEDCRHGEFTSRFYFDHDRKKCVAFHWGGCQAKSQNFFADMNVCQDLCESPPRELTQACIQPFDKTYEDSCSAEKPQQYYYFDSSSGICKMFWFGNCKGENENIFSTLESCQWICERKREERKPAICADKFDQKYTESCGNSQWTEKWYFDQSSGDCTSFWWDGCTSSSQNIFPDEKSCTSNCKHPGFEISSKLATEDSKFRCLEPVEIGNCQETYPAFYYDRTSRSCRPFAYSGCGGNSNRFMTVSQCENLCFAFNSMNEAEVDCHLPMHIGYGKNEDSCLPQAGFRFYYDRNYGKCSQMWYLGCGGNANNFYSYEICQRTCSQSDHPRELERKTRASSEVCFEAAGDRGICGKNSSTYPLQRWTYGAQKCTSFTYSGCGGNRNRFATEDLCEKTCKGLLNSNDPRICSFPPDWGSCNQLRYVWFYNLTRGTCDQFLYGGCGGNPNRFETFEICQKACEVTGTDPCMESLDRGSWCEAMSNRYYFNKRARQCKGFHYTGCGKSGNNFLTKEECQTKCEKRFPRAAPAASKKKTKVKLPVGYSGSKPKDKTPMLRHINLNGFNQTYFKSEPQWMDYTSCYGYRYNVSGRDTILNVHYCSLRGSSDCLSESYRTTAGEEYCNILRPFLRGQNLYSFYFGLDSVNPLYHPKDGLSGRVQRKNETIAAVLVLKANHCHDIC